ncbi:hypothetical protein ACFQ60_10780 [Streptomyces zhihengii]
MSARTERSATSGCRIVSGSSASHVPLRTGDVRAGAAGFQTTEYRQGSAVAVADGRGQYISCWNAYVGRSTTRPPQPAKTFVQSTPTPTVHSRLTAVTAVSTSPRPLRSTGANTLAAGLAGHAGQDSVGAELQVAGDAHGVEGGDAVGEADGRRIWRSQ